MRKDKVLIPPTAFYPSNAECIILIFDLRDPRAVQSLHHERAVWQGDSDIKALDEDHFVLIVRPGSVDADFGTSSTAKGGRRG